MSLTRLILSAILCAAWFLVPANSVAIAEDKTEATAQDSSGSSEPKNSNHDITQEALDQIIALFKNEGDSENVAALESMRNEFADADEIQNMALVGAYSCKLIQYYQNHNELLSARRLVPNTLQIAKQLK